MKDVARRISNYLEAEHVSKERSASLDLLLRFQRLLVSKLYLGVSGTENINGYSERFLSRLSVLFLGGKTWVLTSALVGSSNVYWFLF